MSEKKKKKNVADYPHLAAQWSDKNEFPPDVYSDGSHKRVWWKCENPDHPPWQTELRKRTKRGFNCPYCSKKKASKDHNLAVHNPDLVKEWDYEKNDELGIKPESVSPFSNKKAWWICSKGDSWFARINSRNRRDGKIGNKCPYCSGHKATPATSLAAVNPDLAAEWHPTKNPDTPWEVKPKSAKKRWWICLNGHEWRAALYSRSDGRGCPLCMTQMCRAKVSRLELHVLCEIEILFDKSNVLPRHRISGYEADIFIEDQDIAIEVDGYYYHKDRHDFDTLKNNVFEEMGITLVRLRENGLNRLADYDVFYDPAEDKALIIGRLAERISCLDVLQPHFRKILREYARKGRLINKEGYKERYKNIFNPPPGKSLVEIFPEVEIIWDFEKNFPITPVDVLAGTADEAWFRCPVGKHPSGKMKIYNVRNVINSKFKGCSYCSGKKVTKEESLAATHPEIAARWDQDRNGDLTPFDVTAKSGLRAWFVCPRLSCSRSYLVTIGSIVRTKGFGCSECHNRYGQYHTNDRQSSEEILKQLDEQSDSEENADKSERGNHAE